MKKVIIFDIDGTLVDTNWLHTKAWQEAFGQFGTEVDALDVLSQIGRSSDDIIAKFMGHNASIDVKEQIRDSYRRIYGNLAKDAKGFPKVRELFTKLRAMGKRIVLASSAKEKVVNSNIDLVGIRGLIDGVITSSKVKKSKPDPEIFDLALAVVEGNPSEAVVVGDSAWDMEAARTLGIAPVGVLTGGIPENVLKKAGAIAVYRDIEELYKELDSSPLCT